MVYCGICEGDFPEEEMRKVIFNEGITNVCSGCYREDMPMFEKPDMDKLRGIYNRRAMYKRLSESAGVKDIEEHKKRISEFGKDSAIIRDAPLRRIVNRNLAETKIQKNENLVDNFHWIIMRARRSKKISQKQLAEEIQEPEEIIAMSERGIISPANGILVKKLEEFLRIKILKKPAENKGLSDYDKIKMDMISKLKEGNEIDIDMAKNLNMEDIGKATKKRKWWQFGKRKEKESKGEAEETEAIFGEEKE